MNSKQTSADRDDDRRDNVISDLLGELNVALCTCSNLRKTTRVVTQLYDRALKPVGLTPGQFTVLAALARVGAQRQAKLAETLLMDRTTLIRNLRPLEAKDLVAVDNNGARGAKTLRLSKAGVRTLKAALPLWQQAQAQIIEGLGAARWGRLIEDLASTVEVVQQS